MTGKIKVVIFARVSTNVQDYERQVNELTDSLHLQIEMDGALRLYSQKRSAEQKRTLNEKNLVRWWSLSKATQ